VRVGIDIDDVLYPWYDVAHQICTRAGITNGATPTSWQPFHEYGCTDQQWFDALAAATLTGELYSAAPFPGTPEQLSRLIDAGHTVHLVTARGFMQNGTEIRQSTIEWLDDWSIPHHSLTFAKDKRAVLTDVFLDDAAHNYDQIDDHTEVWLLHAPHNVSARAGRRSVPSVAAFVDLILERTTR
jgi:hypothetical protein